MANKEHFELIKRGAAVWNAWRARYPEVKPDLTQAMLSGVEMNGADVSRASMSNADLNNANLSNALLNEADLHGANLSWANLRSAYLYKANLSGSKLAGAYLINADLTRAYMTKSNLNKAILRGACLTGADLTEADLSKAALNDANLGNTVLCRAILSEADLSGASLNRTDLSRAILVGADLKRASFVSAKLNDVDLSKAEMGWTTFGAIDVRSAKGLENICHRGPSTVGLDTVYLSQGNIPKAFLQGVGAPDAFIDFVKGDQHKTPQFYSCFISYSSKDQSFAERLYGDLQHKGVRCWFAAEDLAIGEKIRTGIDNSIRSHDKLLLVLSRHSVASDWVEQEVETALARERAETRLVLIPIRLDDKVMKINTGWPGLVKNTRNIGDFTEWDNQGTYQKALQRLVRDLKADGSLNS